MPTEPGNPSSHRHLALLIATVLVLAGGCRGQRGSVGASSVAVLARAGQGVLVLPPVSPDSDTARAGQVLGKQLQRELLVRLPATVLYAGDIERLTPCLTWENLSRDGTVDPGEAAAIGRTLGCGNVVAARIVEMDPFPPQRLAMQLFWIDSRRAVALATTNLVVTLEDDATRAAYLEFAGHNPWDLREDDSDRVRAALLSQSLFRRFAAVRAAAAICQSPDQIGSSPLLADSP